MCDEEAHNCKKELIRKDIAKRGVELIRLQFIDIFGFAKNVSITPDELDSALDGELMFDGSSVDGYGRIEESDMYLVPDLETFAPFSWNPEKTGVAHIICNVYGPDKKPFIGCPRNILKRSLAKAKELGYEFNVGPEGEFFLFPLDKKEQPVFNTHDDAGYFDLSPVDRGEDARRDMIVTMKKLGFSIETSHHEVAPGQHEIDFKYDEALKAADQWIIFKQIVKSIANNHGLYASFIPKPFSGENANAMHCNQSLKINGDNGFHDPDDPLGLSQIAKYYIGGLIKHGKGIAAICNPTVNSYKRLVPGYEAPTNISWSCCNRSTFIRIPLSRGERTRLELRTPDPTANPYLVFAVMLSAGLDGIINKIDPPEDIKENVGDIPKEVLCDNNIANYPNDLEEALDEMEKDPLIKETLGKHAYRTFIRSKRAEWREFEQEVHPWEIKKYFRSY
ncbi:type I glutamate--ammonia ligase [Herbivorax sp. ANBcel31]|uniref:type I glutamate--ammonia ligase n=1 Tax=Herbivorax sp. ANBcel31 TaxID=3069754 RepID=UPI0027B79D52|nr:type I glutamate--ammonia ligase [Herbivorax sp. ANBcel31]MDQ2085495.1 type I glutamate--ammonia ligase [Herbivorax sp. ANBcel31]